MRYGGVGLIRLINSRLSCTARIIFNYFRNGTVLLAVSFLFLSGTGKTSADDSYKLESANFQLGKGFKNHSWNSLYAGISNNTDRGEYLSLVLDLDGSNNSVVKARYSKKIWMPANSRRYVELNAYLAFNDKIVGSVFNRLKRGGYDYRESNVKYSDNTERTIKTSPHSKPYKFKVYLYAGSPLRKVDSYEIFAMPFFPDSNIVLSVAGGMSGYNVNSVYNVDGLEYVYGEYEGDFSTETTSNYDRLFDKGNYPEYNDHVTIDRTIGEDYLPGDYTGYQPADTLLLSGFGSAGAERVLDHAQREALVGWVCSGGNIVFLPGFREYEFNEPFFNKIIPGMVCGRKPVDKNTSGWADISKNSRNTDIFKPYSLEFSIPEKNRVVLGSELNAFLVKRDIAAGQSWMMALNGGALALWKENTSIWDKICGRKQEALPAKNTLMVEKAPVIMQQVLGVTAPDRNFMFALLGGYALLCFLILLLFRIKGRAELAWPVVIVLALTAFAIAVYQGMSLREKTGFATGQIEISEYSNNSPSFASNTYFSVFSPKSFGTDSEVLSNTYLKPYYNRQAAGWKNNTADILSVVNDDSLFVRDFNIKGGEVFTCVGNNAGVKNAVVDIDMQISGKGIGGKITNLSKDDYKDCLLVVNRRVLRLGNLAKGEVCDLSACEVSSDGVLANSDFITDERMKLRNQLLSLLRKYPKDYFESGNSERKI